MNLQKYIGHVCKIIPWIWIGRLRIHTFEKFIFCDVVSQRINGYPVPGNIFKFSLSPFWRTYRYRCSEAKVLLCRIPVNLNYRNYY